MSVFTSNNRPKTIRNLPVVIGTPRRASQSHYNLSATFITQIMIEHQRTAGQPQLIRPPRNSAVDAYRAGTKITHKRMPAGFSLAEVA